MVPAHNPIRVTGDRPDRTSARIRTAYSEQRGDRAPQAETSACDLRSALHRSWGFASADQFCAAFDEVRRYFRVPPRTERPIPLATQRRLFAARRRSLIQAMQDAVASDPSTAGRITTLRRLRCPEI